MEAQATVPPAAGQLTPTGPLDEKSFGELLVRLAVTGMDESPE